MPQLIPKITIAGRAIDFVTAGYVQPGGLAAASLQFQMPTHEESRKLWNQEVAFYVDKNDSKPIFRGWINRTKKTDNYVDVFAEDVIGYMIKGGDSNIAELTFNDKINIDGLTIGAAIKKVIELAKLDDKVGTDYIGDTSPRMGTVQKVPIRGTVDIITVFKTLLSRPIDVTNQSLPRPNIMKVMDDGIKSQLFIELQADPDTDPIKHIFTTKENITALNVIDRKVPTFIVVNGKNNVSGEFVHDGAIEALDRSFLRVTNENLESPAACREFGARLFQANLEDRYQYGISVLDGYYLNQNDIVKVTTDNDDYSGNYRITAKRISVSATSYAIGVTINKKAPTLAEYINSRDN
jgi:hypothetical protein